ncbi:VanZ family protein [Amycolatopsis jiangsuensis]|uniref:Glycopeptide antibiotics resistance protein n=1 Tax=Amycolatopsis jiangsuensis TaxID=1181879 RepID=A0A840J6B2_9PSEU|nr:VanZ family protein [Amycolatopsis jiangsuensis]MBB4688972.1 glycopeptide antibiotics resistance protein [Amycolatopsis jiangsuensis]
MTQWSGPTLIAVLAGFGLAFVLVVPYVAVTYRRRGELGTFRAVAAPAFLVYAFALVTYTLLPIPDVNAAYCATHGELAHPEWNPVQFLSDMREFDTSLLHNPALRQVLFNVAFFVPWGVFLRRLFGRSTAFAIASGFAMSLLIETTQLTGVWFLMPCPYRLFDTGDLLTNTLGAAMGALLAPRLRRRTRAPAGEPRPVRTRRRLLGMILDLVAVTLFGAVLNVVVLAVEYVAQGTVHNSPAVDTLLYTCLPAVLLLLVVPLATNGATPGQHAVLLTVVDATGRRPSPWRSLVRFVLGSGGYFLLSGFSPGWSALWLVANLALLLLTRGPRGLTGRCAGLTVADARDPAQVPVPQG